VVVAPGWWVIIGMIIARLSWRRSRWCIIIIRLLIWKLPSDGGLARLLGRLFIVHGRRVLLYIRVELILCEWLSIPAIKVKQKRCRQTDWSIRLHYLPGWFLEKGYLKRQVIQTSMREINLWCSIELKSSLSTGNWRSKTWGTTPCKANKHEAIRPPQSPPFSRLASRWKAIKAPKL
jgi:hypothetical protein